LRELQGWARKPRAGTRDGAPQFFTRRLIRIVPLYWLGTLALAAIALKAPGMLNHTSLDADKLLGSLFFIPVWNESIQYHMPLLTLGWSLNYEILFYLVFFIALKISHQHRLLNPARAVPHAAFARTLRAQNRGHRRGRDDALHRRHGAAAHRRRHHHQPPV